MIDAQEKLNIKNQNAKIRSRRRRSYFNKNYLATEFTESTEKDKEKFDRRLLRLTQIFHFPQIPKAQGREGAKKDKEKAEFDLTGYRIECYVNSISKKKNR